MVYREAVCPHCGNETTIKNVPEGQKCKWCRRLIKAKFTRRKNGKWLFDVEAIDFESPKGDFTPFKRGNKREG